MVYLITGIMGGGKGYATIDLIYKELCASFRPIITNFAIEKLPWVNGQHKPQLGLQAYLRLKWKGDEKRVQMALNRVFRLDTEAIAEFFLYRAKRDGDKWTLERSDCTYRETKDGEKRVLDFDPTLMETTGPCVYIIDEAWKFWGARHWQKTGEGVIFYVRQSRKSGDDVYIATQRTKDIDSSIVGICQEFWVCRNRSLLTVGKVLRQPDDFKIYVYTEPPTGAAQKPMRVDTLVLDKDGLAQCYDTTGGVGLAGRSAGDMGRKKNGLPFWTVWVVAAFLPIGIWFVLDRGLGMVVHKAAKPAQTSAATVAKAITDYGQANWQTPTSQPPRAVSIEARATNEVFMSGYTLNPDRTFTVMLTDGRVATTGPRSPIVFLQEMGVQWGNSYYPVQRSSHVKIETPQTYPVYSQPYSQPQSYVTTPQVQTAPSKVIIFGRRGQQTLTGVERPASYESPLSNKYYQ